MSNALLKVGRRSLVATLFVCSSAGSVLADSAADLGGKLTPVGAERAGNAEGTIPEWTGGNMTVPSGWKTNDPRVSPYADEDILFTIDASNVDQYKDKLTEGQIAMIERQPGYRMDIYPTHRSCGYSQEIYDRTKQNIEEAKLGPRGEIIAGKGGFLFPIPENGWEVITNHRIAYRGLAEKLEVSMAVVRDDGGYNLNVGEQEVFRPFFDDTIDAYENGYMSKLIYAQKEPASAAGGVLMSMDPFDGAVESWAYIPGLRRVKKAPTANYDNPVPSQDGLRTFDQTFMFNGMGDRYNWELKGKQELFVPYNAEMLRGDGVEIADIVGPEYPNRDLTRYELHRVWVVEATLKPEFRNIFTRRVFYVDEDSWTILLADLYDKNGDLWRVEENHIFMAPEIPGCITAADFYFDLNAERYIADNMIEQGDDANYRAEDEIRDDNFTPASLRRYGRQ